MVRWNRRLSEYKRKYRMVMPRFVMTERARRALAVFLLAGDE